MNSIAGLRGRLSEPDEPSAGVVEGEWRPISACLDEDTGEFLNVGVLFAYQGKVEVRMLDSFDRIKCLYGSRIDPHDLSYLLNDIEEAILEVGPANLADSLSDTVRLGNALYAAGASPEDVVDEFFFDVVTLGKPNERQKDAGFRYRSNTKVRETVFEIMKEKMHMDASRIIQDSRYNLKMLSGHRIEVDVPLLSENSAGGIVSAWYKSPLVVENNLLQASADLLLVSSNTNRQKASMSVLVPTAESGLDAKEFNKHYEATYRQLDRLSKSGIEVIEASSVDVLANLTIDWWRRAA
jgi:hypothetical protein